MGGSQGKGEHIAEKAMINVDRTASLAGLRGFHAVLVQPISAYPSQPEPPH